MKNKDEMLKARQLFAKNLKEALDANDVEQIAQAFDTYSGEIQRDILAAHEEFVQTADAAVLNARGMRAQTSAEQKFFTELADAAKASDPKQALSNLNLTIPEETIDAVIEDIGHRHPLLSALGIVNTHGSLKYICAKNPRLLATWGRITSAFETELSGAIFVIKLEDCKLSAFLPVPKDLIQLGAAYIDMYARRILADALAFGAEYGAIKGSGKDEPIGMKKDLKGAVVDGVYPDKTPVALKSLDIAEYNSVVAKLAKDDDGNSRPISGVGLIVNSVDYLTKIAPASTVRLSDGTYKSDIFPYPTTVYQSEMIDDGEAILGIIDNYIFALSTGIDGNIEYSDHAQFLQDNRVYTIKLLGNGRPKNNTDFVFLDISEMKPYVLEVNVKNIAEAKRTITYIPVEEPTGNPAELGYYEVVDGEMVETEDTEVDSDKTYYIRRES